MYPMFAIRACRERDDSLEQVFLGFSDSVWPCAIGPQGMPRLAVERLNRDFNEALTRPPGLCGARKFEGRGRSAHDNVC
jgi:hypothetical protein